MPIEHASTRFNVISADLFGSQLTIGADDFEIEVPRVDSALAEKLVVHKDNPWYSTDGYCLFSKDGTSLIRCLTNVEHYAIPDTCIEVDDEAFAYNNVLRDVRFHDGMTRIGDRAFICSTLDEVRIPASIRAIGKESFAEGKRLRTVKLEEGLREIGDLAFSECRLLEQVNIPASVESLGSRVFNQCRLRACGKNRGLVVSEDNRRYFVDDSGVLYRNDDDGITLMEAINPVSGRYSVVPGTMRILDRAFAFNRKLQIVDFPNGLKSIGDRAFLECESLARADLPEGVVEIGTEGFYHSGLTHLRLPASLERLGPASLVVGIIINDQSQQTGVGGRGASDFYQSALSGRLNEVSVSRFDVEVSPDNPKYTLVEGFLCEKPSEEAPLRAVQYVGGDIIATIPRSVTHIAAYALFGVERLRELHLHTGIEQIGHSALAISYPLDAIEIDDGEDRRIRLYPAPNSSGTVAQRKAFRTGSFDLELLVKDCDSSLSFMMPGAERAHRMLLRLVNGRMLADRFQREFANTVRISTDELVRKYALLENRNGIRNLLDLGFIDADSIAHSIEVANAVGGVVCSRLLLEEKRLRFPDNTFDFSL